MTRTSGEEYGIGMKYFLFDEWGIQEEELYDRLVLPGREIICDFGAGVQGIAYMAEDGSFVKVTDDVSEVAFAMLLRDAPLSEFPRIDDVFFFEMGDKRLFAIYRESVDDYLDPFDDEDIEEPVVKAMLGAGRSNPPDYADLERLETISPRHHREIVDLLASLKAVRAENGYGVSDLHADNIGRTDDGRVVVRDFGHNSLSRDKIEELVSSVRELPILSHLTNI